MNNKLIILAVLGVFIAAAGTLDARGSGRNEEGRRSHGHEGWGKKIGKGMLKHMRNKLSDQLDLDADQEKKLEAILNAKAEKIRGLMKETRKKGQEIRKEGIAEMKVFLDANQAKKLDRIASRMQRRNDERRERWTGETPEKE